MLYVNHINNKNKGKRNHHRPDDKEMSKLYNALTSFYMPNGL
jgi:hypothetical protein